MNRNKSKFGNNAKDVASLSAQLADKAQKTYVDQQISNIGNASPKGTYATLTALQTAFPTGTTGIYLVTADGKWYYWNGTAWTAGGTYQSTGIADSSIAPNMLSTSAGDGLAKLYNLCDYSKITQNFYLDINGNPVSAANQAYSDYIPITVGKTYCFYGAFSLTYQVMAYDTNKTFLFSVPASNLGGAYHAYTYTVPSNVVYLRINMSTDQIKTMVVEGTTYPATYTSYGRILLSTNLADGIKNSLNLGIMYTDSNFNTTLGQYNLTNKNNTKYATAFGYNALKSNTTDGTQDAGLYNTAVGAMAMQNNTIGNHNTAVGFQTAMGITTGVGNTALGEDALFTETTGGGNTALGNRAIQNSTGANNNTAVGLSSMYWSASSNVTGSENTAIGHYSGQAVTSDTNCTFVGYFASKDSSANSYTNSTAIGSNAKITKNNQMMLGNTAVTEVDTYGDFQCLTNGKGLILLSPNGSKFKLTISDAGALTITPTT